MAKFCLQCINVVQVSPHEFMQAVMSSSNKRFTIEQQGDVLDFWAWFINTLHQHLSAGKRNKSSIISKCFQVSIIGGQLRRTEEKHMSGAKPKLAVLTQCQLQLAIADSQLMRSGVLDCICSIVISTNTPGLELSLLLQ